MCLCSGSERLFHCSLLSSGCNVFMVYHRISVCLQVKEDFCISVLRFTDNTSEAKSIPVHNLVQKQLHISPSDTCGDWVIRSKLRTDFILCAGFTQSEIICRKPLGYLKWTDWKDMHAFVSILVQISKCKVFRPGFSCRNTSELRGCTHSCIPGENSMGCEHS